MAMRFGVVAGQRLVGVLHRLGKLACITIDNAGLCMSHDQEVGIAGRVRDAQHLFRPQQGLRYAPLSKDGGAQSPEE
jgi:hypothetical protein